MVSPAQCTVVTELMPSWSTLWAQRLRWQRGALENIGAYGITPQTLRYWAQQLGIGYGVIALGSYLLLIFLMVFSLDTWIWFPFWLGLGILFMVERVATVWKGGWRAWLLAVTLFPELFFDMFLNAVYLKGVADISLGRTASWKHVTHVRPLETTGRNDHDQYGRRCSRGTAVSRVALAFPLVRDPCHFRGDQHRHVRCTGCGQDPAQGQPLRLDPHAQ